MDEPHVQFDKSVSQMNEAIKRMKEESNKLNNDIKHKKDVIQQLENTIRQGMNKTTHLNKEAEQTQNSLKEQKYKLEGLKKEVKQFDDIIMKKKSTVQQLENIIKEKLEKAENMEKEVKQLNDTITQNKEFVEKMNEEVKQLDTSIEHMKKETAILDKRIKEKKDMVETKNKELVELNNTIHQKEEDTKKLVDDIVQKLDAERLLDAMEELKEQLADALDAEEAKNHGEQSQAQVRDVYQNRISDMTTEMQTMTSIKYMQEVLSAINTVDPYRVHDEEKLKAIGHVFVSTVIPGNVLHMFHKYNSGVLVQQDIDKVTREADNHGRARGAAELLNILPAYQGWYECLLQVLRDDEVKQGHVADMMEEAVAEAEQRREAEEAAGLDQGAAAPDEESTTAEELSGQMQSLYGKTLQAMKTDMRNLGERDKIREAMRAVRTEGSSEHPIYDENIVKKIRTLFVSAVNPLNVLHMFHHYNHQVLLQQDIDEVTRKTENHGTQRGAAELLSRLPRYRGWFPCTLRVLRDRRVKQGHIADEMQRLIEDNGPDQEETELERLQSHGATGNDESGNRQQATAVRLQQVDVAVGTDDAPSYGGRGPSYYLGDMELDVTSTSGGSLQLTIIPYNYHNHGWHHHSGCNTCESWYRDYRNWNWGWRLYDRSNGRLRRN